MGVLTLSDVDAKALGELLAAHGVALEYVPDEQSIPGSYWGEPEAGIIASTVYARNDTPIHSLLHEACHLIVLPPEKRQGVYKNATESVEEENAACYLQIVLADALTGVGRARMMADMDEWGYTFRLGCAENWFLRDAEDAKAWLEARGLL